MSAFPDNAIGSRIPKRGEGREAGKCGNVEVLPMGKGQFPMGGAGRMHNSQCTMHNGEEAGGVRVRATRLDNAAPKGGVAGCVECGNVGVLPMPNVASWQVGGSRARARPSRGARCALGVCDSCNQGVRPCDGLVYRWQDGKIAFLRGIDFRPVLVLCHRWRPGLLPPVSEKLTADFPISSPS